MKAPTLCGTHVRLEPLRLDHAEGVLEAGAAAVIWRHLPRGPIESADDARAFIEQALARRDSLPFAIIDLASGRLAGSTRLLAITEEHRRLEIGYTWLAPEHWRTALNTEAKLLLLRHAFEDWGANRVELKTDLENLRSQAALERLGAQREGVLRHHMIAREGRLRDSVLYSILTAEWPAIAARLERALGGPTAAPLELPGE